MFLFGSVFIKLEKANSMNKRRIPFEFVLDLLESLKPTTKPMFGAVGVYVSGKIVFILREREKSPADNGVWIATTEEHHESLLRDLPKIRSIKVFGPGPTGWQVIPMDDKDFERQVETACQLVLSNDVRIGKIPKSKPLKKPKIQLN